jgi:peptidoglycan/xylan/chitin deacetylase (PgdA/CDA1 family)
MKWYGKAGAVLTALTVMGAPALPAFAASGSPVLSKLSGDSAASSKTSPSDAARVKALRAAKAPVKGAAVAPAVVTLGFDDGRVSQVAAGPLLKSHGFHGVFYLISSVLGESDTLTVAQAKALETDGNEIGSHTRTHADLTLATTNQTDEICGGRTDLIADGFNAPTSLAYPYGSYNATAQTVASGCGFTNARTVADGPEAIPPAVPMATAPYSGVQIAEPANPTAVPPTDAVPAVQLAELKADVLATEANPTNKWAQLFWHDIFASAPAAGSADIYYQTTAEFTAFLDWLKVEVDAGRVVVETPSQVMAGVPDTTAPMVSVTAPVAGSVSVAVNATVNATDNVGVTKVEWYLDGVLANTSTTAPFSWTWNTAMAPNASHSLLAKAYDAAGNVGTSAAVAVTVNNVTPPADTTAPVVSITAPSNNATVAVAVNVTVNATDNVGVTKVEYYLDGAIANTATTTPFSWTWNTAMAPNASHTLYAKAYDAAGNVGTSSTLAVTVDNVTPPVVPYGAIGGLWSAAGGGAGFLGAPLNNEYDVPGIAGARMEDFAGGKVYWSPGTGASEVHGAILGKYLEWGGPVGYGLPLTSETTTPDRVGRFNHFESGRSIYWTPGTGAHTIYGAIRAEWQGLGWELGIMGYPTTDESDATGGRYNGMQGGAIVWSPASGAHETHGAIRALWAAQDFERGPLGFPTSDEFGTLNVFRQSNFQGGYVTWTPAGGAVKH